MERLGSPTALRTIHLELGVNNLMHIGSLTRTSATWPTANRITYVPVPCPGPFTLTKLAFENGTAVSGNLDIGLYTPEGTRIVSTGSTAQAGIGLWQEIDVTDTQLAPGWYYLAAVLDNTTGTHLRLASSGVAKRLYGMMEELAFPLPASATFTACTQGNIPSIIGTGVLPL